MTAYARYESTCQCCHHLIERGEQIRRDPELGWVHPTCYEVLSSDATLEDPRAPHPDDLGHLTELRPDETVCDRCWLIHPKGTCDR